MMKVLIVEDEILSRIGLRQLVDWEAMGFRLLTDAADGETALETIRREQPQIILLDLNIPRINGIRLLEILKKFEYDHRVIIISCNEEFHMVKEAMKLGAYDYLRKLNLSSEELLRILVSCQAELTDKSNTAAKKEQTVIAEIKYDDLLNGAGEQLFNDNSGYEMILCMQMQNRSAPDAVYLLEEKSREFLMKHQVQALAVKKGVQSGYYLFPKACDQSLLEELKKQLELNFGKRIYIGVVLRSINNTQELFKQLALVEQIQTVSYYDEENSLRYFTEKMNASEHNPRGMLEQMQKLRELAAEFDQEQMEECIGRIFHLIRNTPYTSINVLRRIFMDMLGTYSITAQGLDGAIEEIYIRGDNCHYQTVMMMNSLAQIEAWFLEFTREFLKCFLISYKCSRSEILRQTFVYIESHLYQQAQLSDAAKAIGVSAAYLSTLFKKEMEQNFIDYVNMRKIKLATQLLSEGKMVYEVSEILGFENSTYFSKVFKRYKEISPDAYRKKNI